MLVLLSHITSGKSKMPSPSSAQYQWLPGPAGGLLLSSSLATTAKIPLGSVSLIFTTGHVGIDLRTGQLITETVESEFNAIFDCPDAALRNAGAADGILSAFKIVAYLTRAEDDAVLNRVFRERYPVILRPGLRWRLRVW